MGRHVQNSLPRRSYSKSLCVFSFKCDTLLLHSLGSMAFFPSIFSFSFLLSFLFSISFETSLFLPFYLLLLFFSASFKQPANSLIDYDGQCSEDPDAEDGSKSHYAKLENFLRRQLPPIIRSKLEQEVERELNCVEDIMKDKAVQIFQSTTLQLLQLARGGFQEASNSVPNIDGEPGPSESALPPSFDTSVLGDPDLGELFSSEFTFDNFYNFPLGQAGFEDGVTDLAYEPTSNACSRDSYGRCPATECEPLRTRKTHAPVFT